MRAFEEPLPVDEALPALRAALEAGPNAVLVAPPGAGKTTRVPLALLDEPWMLGRRLLVLEPRRLAARAAAARMAQTLGERIGDTVGLRVRLETRVSARTRIEVVTEGVFTRMILKDPSLEGVAAVLFDEFHERSLDADEGLALALDAQSGLREDLRLLVMSATLDGARVARLLGRAAPVIESAGRAFEVETRYVGRDPRRRIEEEVAEAILGALRQEAGSILAFLPGQGEIRRTERVLADRLRDPAVDLAPLYGAMDFAAQDLAVRPAATGRRKVVLATSIAETSLTIEGVRVVIDSGLARVPRYEPDIGVTRLETVRVSRAAADQRRGRAGRTEPGLCLRLWAAAANGSMEAFAPPEILSADLSPLLLDCASWGLPDPGRLAWLDPPPRPAVDEARALLRDIGALDEGGRLTQTGGKLAGLSLPPRLASMVVGAEIHGEASLAAEIAAVITERGLGGNSTDLVERVEQFRRERGARPDEMRRLAAAWARAAGAGPDKVPAERAGAVLALAFPDRVAVARGRPGAFTMENGRGAIVEPHDRLAREAFLAIAEIAGAAGSSRILLAAPLSQGEVEALPGLATTVETEFDAATAALQARKVRRYRRLVLSAVPAPLNLDEGAAEQLAAGIARLGIGRLPWTRGQLQVRSRVAYLREADPQAWPDLTDARLAATASDWLAPFIAGRRSLAAITPDDLDRAMDVQLPYAMRRRLDTLAPTHFRAPTGSEIAIDYDAEGGPAIAIRVQELFGLASHPAIAGGRIPLTIELLSPARRPVQVTKDLPGFWDGSYAAVRSEMRGRYPKHPWPEDPRSAAPTTRAKPRG